MTETPGLVIAMRAVPRSGFDAKDLKTLDGRYRCLVRIRGHLLTAVLCQSKLSPSREYIQLGDFYSDGVRGWLSVTEIEIVEVLARIVASLRDQCALGGVAFFFKQWGAWLPRTDYYAEGNHRDQWCMRAGYGNGVQLLTRAGSVQRLGKKAAGRELDGRTHDDYPA